MHNSQYWDKRALDKYDFVEKQSEEYMDKIKSIYTHAFREIDKDIHRVYTNYLKDLKNNSELPEIDTQKLKELLTKSETEKTWKELKQKGLDKYIQDNYKARISRLEQIQAQVYSKIKMISYKENETATEMYKGVINDSYYKTMFDIQQGFNQDFEFSRLDNNLINTVLDNKWSGKNYSQRIWKNTDILAEKVSDIIGGGLIRGQSIEKMSRQLREQFNAGKYYADRLARTEMCHFYNEADRMAYEELGVDKYVFMAVLDNRTSEYCQEMDNKIIEYKNIKVGENFPPLHPNCRSTTRGYIEGFEDEIKRRAKNPITGENEVIDNIPYKEWIKQYQIPTTQKAPVKKEQIKNKNFVPAKDFNEWENRIKNTVGAGTIKLNKMDLNVGNQYLEGLEQFYNDYPKLKGFVQNISTKVNPREMAHFEMTGEKNESGRKLNTGYQLRNPRDPRTIIDDIKRMVDSKFLYENTSLRSIAIHEATHSLDFAITLKNQGIFSNGKFDIDKINKTNWYEMSSSNSFKIIMEARRELFGKENGREIYEAQKVLGEYSFTNYAETLAQAVSYEYTGQSTEYTKKIKEIFDRYYKEAFEK